MVYRHYETRGLILGWRNFGEANRFYQILTPDFGLLQVAAQGIRREKSKFRYQLNGLLVELVLIRGREHWRLVGVKAISAPANRAQISFSRRVGSVLLRLLQGEEASHHIFDDLCLAWIWLASEQSLPTLPTGQAGGQAGATAESAVAEIFCLVRLLAVLGYLAETDVTSAILSAPDLNQTLVEKIEVGRADLIAVINASLAASGL